MMKILQVVLIIKIMFSCINNFVAEEAKMKGKKLKGRPVRKRKRKVSEDEDDEDFEEQLKPGDRVISK